MTGMRGVSDLGILYPCGQCHDHHESKYSEEAVSPHVDATICNAMLWLVFCALSGTGLLLAFRLPPGSRGGRGLSALGWDRHEWGDLHAWISYAFLALILLHMALHWRWFWQIAARRRSWPLVAGDRRGNFAYFTDSLQPVKQEKDRKKDEAVRGSVAAPASDDDRLAPAMAGCHAGGMLTVYVYQKCSTCRDALKWLDENGIAHQVKMIRETPPTPAELKTALDAFGGELRKIFNTSGMDYRALGFKDQLPTMSESAAFELLSKNGNLVKRPFLIGEGKALVGFKVDQWRKTLA